MAISVNVYFPLNRNPDRTLGETQSLRLVGDGTEVMVAAGGGTLDSVDVAVAGTLAQFFDTPSGGTADATTLIANMATSVTGRRFTGPIVFTRGLTVITTGAASDMTIRFNGRPTVSSRTFP